jgi:hypothetical protein
MTAPELVPAFEACTLAAERFRHREHLLVAWTYLRETPLAAAAARFIAALRRFAEAHGAPAKYHETVTWAYLALVNERLHGDGSACGARAQFDAFLAANADLLDPERALGAYYDPATLASERARRVFVLPRRSP